MAQKVRALKAWPQLKADPNCKHPQKAMLARKAEFPGIFPGCVGKWQKVATKENWFQVEANMGKLAATKKQVPQWVLRSMGVEQPGSGREPGKLPPALLSVAEEVLLRQLEVGNEITVPAVTNLLHSCIEVWNAEVEAMARNIAEGKAAAAASARRPKSQAKRSRMTRTSTHLAWWTSAGRRQPSGSMRSTFCANTTSKWPASHSRASTSVPVTRTPSP